MKRFVSTLLLNGLALWLLDYLMTSVQFNSAQSLALAALLLALLNCTVKPILKFISIPITILTFGLFSWIINAFVLEWAIQLSGASISGFSSALLGAVLLALINALLNSVFKEN